ncbi:unnamed protein product [Arctogadus glacialis]
MGFAHCSLKSCTTFQFMVGAVSNSSSEVNKEFCPVVVLSGHLDSWDVGQGAMDDGGGAIISWEALSVIKDLGLRPRRTLRAVLWTAEEQGGVGAQQYYQRHKANISNFDLVMESDLGTFAPVALQFTGSPAAQKVMQEVVQLLAPLNTTRLEPHGEGTDIGPWMQAGVPGHVHRLVVSGLNISGLSKRRARQLAKYCSISAVIGCMFIWKRRCFLYP